jgi:hypothetical protein
MKIKVPRGNEPAKSQRWPTALVPKLQLGNALVCEAPASRGVAGSWSFQDSLRPQAGAWEREGPTRRHSESGGETPHSKTQALRWSFLSLPSFTWEQQNESLSLYDMSNPSGHPIALDEIWNVQDADAFAGALIDYLYDKESKRRLPLSGCEQNVRDISNLYASICIDGFNSLFYQVFSLADCHRVEAAMREMGLRQLADWFAEARLIYCRRRTDLSEEAYDNLEPFSLDGPEGLRFDEIGKLFVGDESELFRIAAPVKAYATLHRGDFT